MRRLIVVSLIVSYLAPALRSQSSDDTKRVDLFDGKKVSIWLEVHRQASWAEPDWIWIHFDNHTEEDLLLVELDYQIRFRESAPEAARFGPGSAFGSGSICDVFGPPIRGPHRLPPGHTRGPYPLSERSSCSFRDFGFEGKTVVGLEFRADIRVERLGRIVSKQTKHPFSTIHVPTTPEALERGQARLRAILKEPSGRTAENYWMKIALEVPAVTPVITTEEIVSALRQMRDDPRSERERGYVAWNELLQHVADSRRTESAIKDFFLEWLQTGQAETVRAMNKARVEWDPCFLYPLVDIFTTPSGGRHPVVEYLARSGMPQRLDPQVARRLTTCILYGLPIETLGDPRHRKLVERSLYWLGHTQDRRLLPFLRPLLDDTSPTPGGARQGIPQLDGDPPPGYRICDAALDAVLYILDGDLSIYDEATERWNGNGHPALLKYRDQLIKKVIARLDQ